MKYTQYLRLKEIDRNSINEIERLFGQPLLEDGDKGVVGRGMEKLKSKILSIFKTPVVRRLISKYQKDFLKDVDKIIDKYIEISKSVKSNFKDRYEKLKKEYDDFNEREKKGNLGQTDINYKEEKLKLKIQNFKEDMDDYFKINNMNSQAEQLINSYTQMISSKITQKNWFLNVELSDLDKRELEKEWEKRIPLLKLELNKRFIEMIGKSEISEIYNIYNDIKVLMDKDKYESKIHLNVREDFNKRRGSLRYEFTPVCSLDKKPMITEKGYMTCANDDFYNMIENEKKISIQWEKFFMEVKPDKYEKGQEYYIKGYIKVKGYNEKIYSDIESFNIDEIEREFVYYDEEDTMVNLKSRLLSYLERTKHPIKNRQLYVQWINVVTSVISRALFKSEKDNKNLIRLINDASKKIPDDTLNEILVKYEKPIYDAIILSQNKNKGQETKQTQTNKKQTDQNQTNDRKQNKENKQSQQKQSKSTKQNIDPREIKENDKNYIITPDNKKIEYDFNVKDKDGNMHYYLKDKEIYSYQTNEGFVSLNKFMLLV